jgi:hypothetical protein
MKFICNISLITLSALLLFACATVQQTSAFSKAGYDIIWKACIDSLSDVRFSASSTDKEGGLIIADQSVVMGEGSVARLNIMLTKSSGGTSIDVKFVPPPGSVGGFGIVDDYYAALRSRLPDIKAQ